MPIIHDAGWSKARAHFEAAMTKAGKKFGTCAEEGLRKV